MRVIANAGHWSMYEAPEAFDAALAELLARAARR
jgi:pimeloyl-ACP methyl ester carboxylesterase